MIVLIFADLAPFTFQDPFSDQIPHNKGKAYQWLAQLPLKNSRVIDLSGGSSEWDYSGLSVPVYTGFSALNGGHMRVNMPRSRWTIVTLLRKLSDSKFLRSEENIELLRKALFLMDVQYIVSDTPLPANLFGSIHSFPNNIYVGELEAHSPLSVSPAIKVLGHVPREPGPLEEAPEISTLDAKKAVSERIGVYFPKGLQNARMGRRRDDETGSKELVFKLSSYQVTHDSFSAQVVLNQNAYVHIAQSYYGDIKVLRDGKKTEELLQTGLGFIALPVPRGEHTVTVKPGFSPLMQILSSVSAATFLLCGWVLIQPFFQTCDFLHGLNTLTRGKTKPIMSA